VLHGPNDAVCFRAEEVAVEGFVLRSNQTLKLDTIPLDDEDKPMIGFLSVSAKSDSDVVTLDTPLFFEGGAPNTLVVGPGTAKLGAKVSITAHEESGVEATASIGTEDGEAPGTCN